MTTSTTFNVVSVARPAAPRGARWAASLFTGLAGLLAPRRRALTLAEEAAEVREMARHLQGTDPGFASDLLAAADRHETQGR